MLSILGQRPSSFCDGHSRRHFLRIGGLALGGMSLPQILKAEDGANAPSGKKMRLKAVIMIHLSGGLSHQGMYNLKMDAPVEHASDTCMSGDRQ